MSSVAPGDSTVTFIRKKVRRLTSTSSESALPTDDIDQYINNVILNDFPYAIKIDQMRSVYTFFTEPNRDRYPIDVNYNQGIRAPFYVEGILGTFFKDRNQFYNLFPRWPTLLQPISGDGVTTSFTFTVQAPFLQKEVVLGGTDSSGNPITVNDDGNGNLLLQLPNPVTVVPPYTTNDSSGNPIPGMHNQNTGNPGLNKVSTQTTPFTLAIGSVNYTTGAFSINFPTAPASGTVVSLWIAQYQPGRPFCMLFWNNELTVRPVPDRCYKLEIESFLTPVQFMDSTDVPILNQWAQYIAYLASMEILRDRQDLEGVENLMEGMKRQEALVLERQAIEEVGQPNFQIFNSTQPYSVYGGWGGWGVGT